MFYRLKCPVTITTTAFLIPITFTKELNLNRVLDPNEPTVDPTVPVPTVALNSIAVQEQLNTKVEKKTDVFILLHFFFLTLSFLHVVLI